MFASFTRIKFIYSIFVLLSLFLPLTLWRTLCTCVYSIFFHFLFAFLWFHFCKPISIYIWSLCFMRTWKTFSPTIHVMFVLRRGKVRLRLDKWEKRDKKASTIKTNCSQQGQQQWKWIAVIRNKQKYTAIVIGSKLHLETLHEHVQTAN